MFFFTGFTVTVTYGEGQLTITISAPDNFKGDTIGLLGQYVKPNVNRSSNWPTVLLLCNKP